MVGKHQPKLSSVRDDMVIRRAHIGHTYLTHKYLMVKEDEPLCNACNDLLTVKHRLWNISKHTKSISHGKMTKGYVKKQQVLK